MCLLFIIGCWCDVFAFGMVQCLGFGWVLGGWFGWFAFVLWWASFWVCLSVVISCGLTDLIGGLVV